MCTDAENHVKVHVGSEVGSVIAVGYGIDGMLGAGGVGVQGVAGEKLV